MRANKLTCVLCVAVAIAVLAASEARAGSCHERCEESFTACAAAKAAGCKLGGALAGKAAEKLGSQIPIPGMGALFGGMTKSLTEDKCKELLKPCEKIKETCLSECEPTEEEKKEEAQEKARAKAAGTPVAPEPPKEVIKYSTLRIFSDKPRTIVYLNGQRMGATPKDTLEPYVTPQLPVGKYWVRLATTDGAWEWGGDKDVEEGNVNSVEGQMINIQDRAWDEAEEHDRNGAAVIAVGAYEDYMAAYPKDRRRKRRATRRIKILLAQVRAAEDEMMERIVTENDPETLHALCTVFLEEFPRASLQRKTTVNNLMADAAEKLAVIRAEQEKRMRVALAAKKLYQAIVKEHARTSKLRMCKEYLEKYPDGEQLAEVERILANLQVSDAMALYTQITTQGVLKTKLGLCERYLKEFPAADKEERVKQIRDETKAEIARLAEEVMRAEVGKAHRAWGVTLMTLGSTMVVIGGIIGGVTASQYKDLESGCGQTLEGCSGSDLDANTHQTRATDAMLIIGGASLVGGVLLYVLAPSWEDEKGDVSFGIAPTSDGMMFGIGGTL